MDFDAIQKVVWDFYEMHKVLIGSLVVTGVGLYGVRRFCAGGVCRSKARLDGRTVLITGANTGIGRETARDLAARGAKVILACRDLTRAERAAEDIRKSTGNQDVSVKVLDLASLKSVRKFADDVKKTEKRLDILINNAGIMRCPEWQTEEGFEMQMGVNHLGHFVLTNELLDLIKSSAPSRIVTVSSLAHKRGKINLDDINLKDNYDPGIAYANSKLANVLFTRELHKRLQGTDVTAYCLHPGVILTELGRHFYPDMPLWKKALFLPLTFFLKSVPQGAQTSIYCAVQEGIEEHSGKYFSDCAVCKTSPAGQDDDMAKALWELSEKLTKAI